MAGVPSRSLAWVTAHPRHPVTRIADPFCLERRRHRVQRGRNRRQIHEMTLGFEPPIQGRFLGAASTTPHLSMCHVSSVAARGWECNPAWVGDVRTLRTGDPFLGARISLIDRMAAAGGHPLHWNGALTCPLRLLLRLLVLQSLACPPRALETAPGFARLPRAPVCDVATPLPLGDSGRMDRSAGANRPSSWPRAPHPPKAPFDLVLHGTPPLV